MENGIGGHHPYQTMKSAVQVAEHMPRKGKRVRAQLANGWANGGEGGQGKTPRDAYPTASPQYGNDSLMQIDGNTFARYTRLLR